MRVTVRIQWRAGNVIFRAGEARQRMHIRAARLEWTPAFGKNGATTKTYGAEPCTGTGPVMMAKKDACRSERDRAVGGI
ncbi:hypothetical protein EFD55_09605 [Rhizobium pisi]|uniref:Uncharacterized protein n=1 Tax=Rhizobium pisi TaxID=574561 RepID=A0A427N219_9HYPH|nr:hypothetical protein EFD55_09605 [Rhizobium pisi]